MDFGTLGNIMVITGDADFATTMDELKKRGFMVLLAHLKGCNQFLIESSRQHGRIRMLNWDVATIVLPMILFFREPLSEKSLSEKSCKEAHEWQRVLEGVEKMNLKERERKEGAETI